MTRISFSKAYATGSYWLADRWTDIGDRFARNVEARLAGRWPGWKQTALPYAATVVILVVLVIIAGFLVTVVRLFR